MKQAFFLLILLLSATLSAQSEKDCAQLAINFHGFVDSDQLLIEASNMAYTGNLYYYPGFVLLSEAGDTIAKESVTYYGIGTNFQTHLLDMVGEISFPFFGRLELFGSNYNTKFCSFPIEIDEENHVSLDKIKNEPIKVVPNFEGDMVILDLGGSNVNAEKLDYRFNVTNDDGAVVFEGSTDTSTSSFPTKQLGGEGVYFVSVWDEISQKLLPAQILIIE